MDASDTPFMVSLHCSTSAPTAEVQQEWKHRWCPVEQIDEQKSGRVRWMLSIRDRIALGLPRVIGPIHPAPTANLELRPLNRTTLLQIHDNKYLVRYGFCAAPSPPCATFRVEPDDFATRPRPQTAELKLIF